MLKFDIAILCRWLLPMNSSREFTLENQLVGVVGSKIAYVGPQAGVSFVAKKTINGGHQVVMPGLVNGHGHLPMTLFRGLADDLPFHDWLNGYILPLEAKFVAPDFVRAGTRLALLEGFLSGTTTVYDMYYYELDIAEVCEAAGVRALLGETIFDYVAPDNKGKTGNDFKIVEAMVERYKNHELIRPCISPHAPYSCSDDTLRKVKTVAQKHSIPIGIHVSETRGEVDESVKKFGLTPLARLHSLGVLDNFVIAAHCVHLSEEEIALAARMKTSVIYNPESNMKLGAGVAPIPKLIKAGVAVGLGTDGAASNNNLNMFGEMDSAAKLQKLGQGDNTAMTAEMALRMTTIEGARALGLEKVTGSIEVGKCADLLVIDTKFPHMNPLRNLASQLVYSAQGNEVHTVLCHGKVVVENRVCLSLEQDAILDEAAFWLNKMGT